jgi:hypothetical protein
VLSENIFCVKCHNISSSQFIPSLAKSSFSSLTLSPISGVVAKFPKLSYSSLRFFSGSKNNEYINPILLSLLHIPHFIHIFLTCSTFLHRPQHHINLTPCIVCEMEKLMHSYYYGNIDGNNSYLVNNESILECLKKNYFSKKINNVGPLQFLSELLNMFHSHYCLNNNDISVGISSSIINKNLSESLNEEKIDDKNKNFLISTEKPTFSSVIKEAAEINKNLVILNNDEKKTNMNKTVEKTLSTIPVSLHQPCSCISHNLFGGSVVVTKLVSNKFVSVESSNFFEVFLCFCFI